MLRRISLNKHVFWLFLSILNDMRSIAGISTWYPNFLRVFYSLLHSKSVKTQLLCPSKPKEEPSRKHTNSYNRVRAILIFFETVETTLMQTFLKKMYKNENYAATSHGYDSQQLYLTLSSVTLDYGNCFARDWSVH